jgi:hypothetical protein
MNLSGEKPVVFTAMSKHAFYFRAYIVKYAFEQGVVPVNPFMSFDYFLLDSVDRDLVRSGNNTLLGRCDELWVFGPVSDGVLAEIQMARSLEMPVKYFEIRDSKDILPVQTDRVEMEPEVDSFRAEL